jgi:hypothetical protein
MTYDPDTFTLIFCPLKLLDEPGKHLRGIGVGCIDEVEKVALVPEICMFIN